MVPKRLQAVLWNVNTDNLDISKNRHYIVHQILAYGRWEDVKWLFKVYDRETIKKEFIEYPEKDYQPSTFNFVSKILLETGDLDFQRYDRFAPRVIG